MMPEKQRVELGPVEETLLVPLYLRALENRRKRPIVVDPKAAEMVDRIDWDYARIGQRWRGLGCSLRCAFFDVLAADFIRRHPDGTVVEIGCGLSTRFDRLDNGRIHWFDLDLPDVIALRRRFFTDSERCTMLAASVVDPGWIPAVLRSPGPYFLMAETVLVYLEEQRVKTALAQIARGIPGAHIALDTCSGRAVAGANKDHARRGVAARFTWACADPKEIERWDIGLRLVESRTMADVPESLKPRFSWLGRAVFGALHRLSPGFLKSYQLSVFEAR